MSESKDPLAGWTRCFRRSYEVTSGGFLHVELREPKTEGASYLVSFVAENPKGFFYEQVTSGYKTLKTALEAVSKRVGKR